MDKELLKRLTAVLEEQETENESVIDDFPNNDYRYAFLYGCSIENSFNPHVGDVNYLFNTQFEKIYIWTYKENKMSALVSEVSDEVKNVPFWKTAGRLLQLAHDYVNAFETEWKAIDYKWMCSFNNQQSFIDEIRFCNLDEYERLSLSQGVNLKATRIAELASLIELFERDDKAYNAVSLVLSAFSVHWCCLICELSKSPRHDHLAEEPQIWQQAYMLQELEMAIVQSCRAVECIIGEPPNRRKPQKIERFKEKWKDILGIDPDNLFEKAGKSYLEFYYDLFFTLRNPSAHSYGNIHYNLARKRAVEAQCFAAIIIKEYISRNELENEAAIERLHFNTELLSRVSEDLTTPKTNNDEEESK